MLLDANIFQPLIDVFAAVLKFFHNDVGVGWGLAIILLTVIVRVALIPIGIKQFHSMQRMAMHMPEMKVIREKYKDNPQRQQQETMAFYKENNINPFSSCLPLLIQWPFLIGLFWTLRGNLRLDICSRFQKSQQVVYAHAHHVSVRSAGGQTVPCGSHGGSSFLFINDLTNSAHGVEMGILLLLYIGTSIGSSMIMMMPGTERNQRRLMLILPVVFAFITIRFPAGALLYYIVFNLWMIVQQSVFKQLIGQQYRHPAGVAIGVPGDGSVSTGGGIRGLLGMSRTRVSEDAAPKASRADLAALTERAGSPRGGSRQARSGVSSGASTTESRPVRMRPAKSGRNGGASAEAPVSGSTNGASKAAGARQSAPPPSPRKKKKRSGRRR